MILHFWSDGMPAPYSLDLRRKVIAACENEEGTQKEIAEQFDIGYRTLKEWLSLYKKTGDVIPKEHVHRGPLPVFEGVAKTDLMGWFKHCGYRGGLSMI
jgi:transposase-like protein